MQFSPSVRLRLARVLAAAVIATFLATPASSISVDNPPSDWQAPTAEVVEAALVDWLVQSAATDDEAESRHLAAQPSLDALYTDADRLDQVIGALAVASTAIGELAERCQQTPQEVGALEWLDSADIPYWMRANVRLYVGRALVRHRYFEQALGLLDGIAVGEVFDPASLLFYRAIAEHQLVLIEEADQSLEALLGSEHPLPERYGQIARLMQADIANVKKDSLDHIARRMLDVHRRLDLGEANERAQEVERGILASLDKIIKQLEDQQRQQQQRQQQQQSGGQPSGQPMEESRIAEMKGDGKVDIKDIGDQAGWGDLPPRERERLLQQIGRDFPGHYRDLVEEYLKRLATDEREPQEP